MEAVRSLMEVLRTPIAKRKGVVISPEDCSIWAKELEKVLEKYAIG